jgi:hypothetical protein
MKRFPFLVALASMVLASRPCHAQAMVPFGAEFRVNTYTTGAQEGPVVAMNGTGDFVVVWTGYDTGDNSAIIGQRFDAAGSALGGEFRVNTYTTGLQDLPGIARDDLGDFVVIWRNFGNATLRGRQFNAAGVPSGTEFRVDTYTTGSVSNSDVANDSTGAFVVVWDTFNQGGTAYGGDVYARRYTSKAIAIGAEFRVNTYTTGNQYGPAVAVQPSGFVVVFMGPLEDDSSGIGAQRYDSSGSPVAGQFRVNTYTTGTQKISRVASDTHGNILVTWSSLSQGGVHGQRYAASGAASGDEFLVNAQTASSQTPEGCAADANGSFVVVWQSADPAPQFDVETRTLRSGVPQGGDVIVNTFTTNRQIQPSIAAGPRGRFVVVWESENQTSPTSSDDIYARVLRPSGDANGDGTVDIADVFYMINLLFASGPPALGPANPDGVGSTDIADVFYLINFLFASGPAPV